MKRLFFAILNVMLSFSLLSCTSSPSGNVQNSSTNSYKQVSADEAMKIMSQNNNYIILDVRRPDEFSEKHIKGAVNFANEDIGIKDISPLLPDKDALILVYCRSGRRSKEASEKLVKLGYTNIVEFGGILDWTGEIE